jgi:hypothetical protein
MATRHAHGSTITLTASAQNQRQRGTRSQRLSDRSRWSLAQLRAEHEIETADRYLDAAVMAAASGPESNYLLNRQLTRAAIRSALGHLKEAKQLAMRIAPNDERELAKLLAAGEERRSALKAIYRTLASTRAPSAPEVPAHVPPPRRVERKDKVPAIGGTWWSTVDRTAGEFTPKLIPKHWPSINNNPVINRRRRRP